jgi:hypothetical protein
MIRDSKKSLNDLLTSQKARVCHRNPSKPIACGAIHRHRGSSLESD